MNFVKMEGLGNDFIVVEGPAVVAEADIVRWCERRRGIGADGVLEVTPLGADRVRMRYWNADGRSAEMCGNGLRCVARLAVLRGWVEGPKLIVETAVGERRAEVRPDGTVRAQLGVPQEYRLSSLQVAGVEVHPVGLGNPHAVLFVDDPGEAAVATLGPEIETDAIFPAGTNVEFAAVRSPDRIELRVWERGVGETLACGSGAAATVYLARRQGLTEDRVAVDLPGGEMMVEIDNGTAWIEGPANVVFSGTVD
jgi:diaminopimelate epimerase